MIESLLAALMLAACCPLATAAEDEPQASVTAPSDPVEVRPTAGLERAPDEADLESAWLTAFEAHQHECYLKWSALVEDPALTHTGRILRMHQWQLSMVDRKERIDRMAEELDEFAPRFEADPAAGFPDEIAEHMADLKRFHQLAESTAPDDQKELGEIARKLELAGQDLARIETPEPVIQSSSAAETDDFRQLQALLRDFHHHAALQAAPGAKRSAVDHSRSEMLRIAEMLQNQPLETP